jgi:hypothetical protein
MPIKAIYENESDIPEVLKEHYVQRNDKWELQAEGVKTQADVDRLQEALRKEREDARKAKERAAAFGDLDPKTVQAMRDEYEVLKANSGKIDEERRDELKKKLENQIKNPLLRELDELKGKYETEAKTRSELEAAIRRSRMEAEFRSAATQAKVRPEAVEDILRYMDDFEMGEKGPQLKSGDAAGTSLNDWFSEMKSRRSHWWPEAEGAGSRGGGVPGYAGPNPFDPETENVTEQFRIYNQDPKLYERLEKAAAARQKKKTA